MEEKNPIFSVRCNVCGRYTHDVYQRRSDRVLMFNPMWGCIDEDCDGTYTMWYDGVDSGLQHDTLLDVPEDEADLGGVIPIDYDVR